MMNKKQEDYLLHRLAQALAVHNPSRYRDIYDMVCFEYKELGGDEI